jgi:hypothetical protein
VNQPPKQKKPSSTRAAAESVGMTVAVIVVLVIVALALDYGAPGLFGGDDEPHAVPAGAPP